MPDQPEPEPELVEAVSGPEEPAPPPPRGDDAGADLTSMVDMGLAEPPPEPSPEPPPPPVVWPLAAPESTD
ncbi:hypothetical protein [Streptomyces sp. NPDC054784]